MTISFTTAQVANRLIELTRQGLFLEAQQELFAPQAINQEPSHSRSPSVSGLAAILQKEEQFLKQVQQWHEIEVSEPLLAGNYFSLRMCIDVSLQSGKSLQLEEIIVYQIQEGKIVREQFFY